MKNASISPSLQQIFYGAPGTGKSHTINEQTIGESVIRTTFHPDSDYSTFVGAYKPTTKEVALRDMSGHIIKEDGKIVTEDRIVYEFVEQAFLQAYVKAWKMYAETTEGDAPQRQFLVIEEINRGNCAQIFGDLFQLLDRNEAGFSDYPIQADNDMRKQLAKAFKDLNIDATDSINALFSGQDVVGKVLKGEILLLPNNLYIWATMNTSDQSLFPIDSAFKRRWDWQYMPIGKGYDEDGYEIRWAIEGATQQYNWWSFLEKINAEIGEATQSEDKKLGFFFCKATDGWISADKFVGKVIFYLWNDVFKNNGFEAPIFKDADGTELTFSKFYKTNNRGNVIVQKNKVEIFLNNLGVEVLDVNTPPYEPDDDDEDEYIEPNNQPTMTPTLREYNDIGYENKRNFDYSRFLINGEGSYNKGQTVYTTIKMYCDMHPEDTAENIVRTWSNLHVINLPWLVETVDTHEQRRLRSKDSKFDQKSRPLRLQNGETIYISNQLNVSNINDFANKVNAQNWGIRIDKA